MDSVSQLQQLRQQLAYKDNELRAIKSKLNHNQQNINYQNKSRVPQIMNLYNFNNI